MATNNSIVVALQSNPVPPDLQCALPQATADAIAVVLSIAGLASLVGGPGVVPTNNTAAQALQIANQALTLAQQNQANLPIMRGSTTPVPLTTGKSSQAIAFTDVGTAIYSLIITFIGGTTDPGADFGYNIVTGTQTSTGCNIEFYGVPAGWSFTWQLITLTNTTAS